jgi:hypothetical protein
MHLVAIITNLRFQDVLDVLFLVVVAYHLVLQTPFQIKLIELYGERGN